MPGRNCPVSDRSKLVLLTIPWSLVAKKNGAGS